MKKILFLGAAHFQLAPILYAKSRGYKIITCDNKPDNPGHKFADKYYHISTIAKEEILKISQEEKIDGILTFGSDISAPTVAYIAEEMKLIANSREATDILVNKSLFRDFLKKKKLQKINFISFDENQKENALKYLLNTSWPKVIKPVDSAGSKGVSIICTPEEILPAIEYAYQESLSKKIIVEDFIKKKGKQVCGDGYFENGKLKFIYFGDGHFYDDGKHHAPWGESFPSTHSEKVLLAAKEKSEKILQELHFRTGPFNIDIFITSEGEPFINEIGPRSGGNNIPMAIFLNTGVDMVAGCVESSIDKNFTLPVNPIQSKSCFCSYMLHSKAEKGILKEIIFSDEINIYIYQYSPYLSAGDYVSPFYKGNDAIGNIILKFDSIEKVNAIFENIHEHFNIVLK